MFGMKLTHGNGDDVRREAQEQGQPAHLGYVCGICVEKNSELEDGDPAKKYKGRVVVQGNRVVDQNYDAAIFQDLVSQPSTMGASKAADFYGCAPGYDIHVADAEQAYAQAPMNRNSNLGRLTRGEFSGEVPTDL